VQQIRQDIMRCCPGMRSSKIRPSPDNSQLINFVLYTRVCVRTKQDPNAEITQNYGTNISVYISNNRTDWSTVTHSDSNLCNIFIKCTAVILNFSDLWDITPCSLSNVNCFFRAACHQRFVLDSTLFLLILFFDSQG
jgi:hypothetical protein